MPTRAFHLLIPLAPLLLISSALAQTRPAPATAPADAILTDPPRDAFLILPLTVHILSCDARDDLNCRLTDDDVRRIIGKANGIWHKAGIHFALNPILREKAANVDAFVDALGKADILENRNLAAYRLIAPPQTRDAPGLHVYYIHQFPVNGVFLGQTMCVVKDTASLRPVKDGIDEPIPRVTSHEIGHALGLPHRQNVLNLMASGNNGTKLNQAEVNIARAKAQAMPEAATAAQWAARLQSAKADKNEKEATRLQSELDQLPPPAR